MPPGSERETGAVASGRGAPASPVGDVGPMGSVESVESVVEGRLKQRARRERSLLSLLELSNELNVRMDLFEIADVALFNLLGHFGCARGALWMVPQDGPRDAVLLRSQGLSANLARAIGTVWSGWIISRPEGLREPMRLEDLGAVGPAAGLDLAEQGGLALLAPVSAHRKTLGLIGLGKRVDGSPWTAMELEVLQASVNFVGVALENTHLYNRAVENHRQLRLAYEQLQDLDRLKSEFLRNLNHELRTPLTVMAAYLDSLLAEETEAGPRREHLRVVRGESEKLAGMLLNLLDLSRLLENDAGAEVARGDAVTAIEEFFGQRRPGVAAELRELRFSAASTVPPAQFDEARVVQIVDGLVDNAVKFTPAGSVIHLRVEGEVDSERGEVVRIDVADNGPGISDERLPHIFESFRQGDGSETRRHGGMGIGLAIARRLAESMHATLDVTTTIGVGTTFSLRLAAG